MVLQDQGTFISARMAVGIGKAAGKDFNDQPNATFRRENTERTTATGSAAALFGSNLAGCHVSILLPDID